jgi:hypothetical protein
MLSPLVPALATFPFTVGDIAPERGYVHVLDDVTLDIVLPELDTIADFTAYLGAKERLVRSGRLLSAAGEEELLAYYLLGRTRTIGCVPIASCTNFADDGAAVAGSTFLYQNEGRAHRFSKAVRVGAVVRVKTHRRNASSRQGRARCGRPVEHSFRRRRLFGEHDLPIVITNGGTRWGWLSREGAFGLPGIRRKNRETCPWDRRSCRLRSGRDSVAMTPRRIRDRRRTPWPSCRDAIGDRRITMMLSDNGMGDRRWSPWRSAMMTVAITADRKGIRADRDGDPRRSQGPSSTIAMIITTDRDGDQQRSPRRSAPIAMAMTGDRPCDHCRSQWRQDLSPMRRAGMATIIMADRRVIRGEHDGDRRQGHGRSLPTARMWCDDHLCDLRLTPW